MENVASIPTLHFLISQSSKLKAFAHAQEHMIQAQKSSVSPSTVLVLVLAIQTTSNCYIPVLNIAVVHGLVHIVRKVCGCFVLLKKQ